MTYKIDLNKEKMSIYQIFLGILSALTTRRNFYFLIYALCSVVQCIWSKKVQKDVQTGSPEIVFLVDKLTIFCGEKLVGNFSTKMYGLSREKNTDRENTRPQFCPYALPKPLR